MCKPAKSRAQPRAPLASAPTLAAVQKALDRCKGLSETRVRDLRSAVRRVAELLGDEPPAILLSMESIQAGLAKINPVSIGMTPKRFTNLRSDFVAAVKASGLISIKLDGKGTLSPEWIALLSGLNRRLNLGLLRLARFLSRRGIKPEEVSDDLIGEFITAVREGSLHKRPKVLHRQVTKIWNEAAAELGLPLVAVPSFKPPPKRIDLALLPPSLIKDIDSYLAWCAVTDPFAPDARRRPLAPRTLKLAKNQLHAAVSALVKAGVKPERIRSLADLVKLENLKVILRQRLADAGGQWKSFDHYLAWALVRMAKEWVEVPNATLIELKHVASKLPAPTRIDLTPKNHEFLRQFDDPQTLRRLRWLPEKLWKEVKTEIARKPNFRTLAKAQAALGIGLLTYMPIRSENLWELEFDRHIFLKTGPGAVSTLELASEEVKNDNVIAFDIQNNRTPLHHGSVAPSRTGLSEGDRRGDEIGAVYERYRP